MADCMWEVLVPAQNADTEMTQGQCSYRHPSRDPTLVGEENDAFFIRV